MPGEFTEEEVASLYVKQGRRCASPACRKLLRGKFHRDHIVPVELGGHNYIRNIQILCPPCNISKGAKDPIEWANKMGMLI